MTLQIIYICVCLFASTCYSSTVGRFQRRFMLAVDDPDAAQRQSSDLVTGGMGLITPITTAALSCQTVNHTRTVRCTSRVPVGGKSSVFLIFRKYRIIILIIIIKRLGEILLSYIAHTSRTHTLLPLCGYDPGL